MSDTCLVVVHRPGPGWDAGLPLSQQAGIQAHRAHYAQLLQRGLLRMGGPFVDEAGGGMMVFGPGVDGAELASLAAADPAVESGLLVYEIRPWRVALGG